MLPWIALLVFWVQICMHSYSVSSKEWHCRAAVCIWSASVDTAQSGGGAALYRHPQWVSSQWFANAWFCRSFHSRGLVGVEWKGEQSGVNLLLPGDQAPCRAELPCMCLLAMWIFSLVRWLSSTSFSAGLSVLSYWFEGALFIYWVHACLADFLLHSCVCLPLYSLSGVFW